MNDATKHSYGDPGSGASVSDGVWRAEANPDLGYDGGEGGQEPDPPNPDHDMPGDPPPRADLDYDGGQGGEEPDAPNPDHDMPGDDPPPLQVAERNGR